MSDNTIKINRIPSLTWNWLKMNETEIEVKPVCVPEDDFKVNVPADVTFETGPADHCSDIKGALGEVFDEDMKQISGHTDIIRVGEGVKCKEPVVIYGDFKRECAAFNRYVIEAGKDSELTVLIELSSDDTLKCRGCIQMLIRAEEGAVVHMVQSNMLGKNSDVLSDIGAIAEEDARIELAHIFLGGADIYQGCNIDLKGDRSSVKKDIGYFLDGDQNLDMNYVVLHKGKKTECDIKVSGVLKGNSSKLFRGTIDFQNGCAGSKGAEIEEVIMRDDTVSNKTIPVILCAEEDVEGSHGATIGRLDEELIFYMQTRGFEEEEIYRMISRNRLLAFCNKIPDEEIRSRTMNFK